MAVRNSSKGADTRQVILNAAEVLFSEHGYNGTSLRDIANAANVRLSAAHYHFGNKHEIYRAAMERKLDLLQQTISDSFADADGSTEGCLTIEQTIAAFVQPFLTIASTPGHELRHYVLMTSHLMSSYRMPELRPILAKLSVVSDLFEQRIKKLMPHTSESEILFGMYIMEAALIFMVQDPGFLDDLTRNHHMSNAIGRNSGAIIRFFAAGLERIAGEPHQSHRLDDRPI
ncbi:TetR/AcrR family transcriptional regulator [Sphingobium sp. SCG-1]|uniref:TetR/AcrR family transcriptional regulator n=1 Tax=Sphingobium sp. SCG-1 TaxID=2072936 RepID=UPI000CD67B55|nr:TetR family transcriptional regulator [Sphingobium sp. SCG-1]AUW58917.1 TetR/AcrR family transcriptional regulator [Sphingobium sp. SCG-1]